MARVYVLHENPGLEFEDVRQAPARIASKIAGPAARKAERHSYTRPQISLDK